MRSVWILVLLLTAGCTTAPIPVPTPVALSHSFSFAAPATAVADPCPPLRSVDCFEPTVAADPRGRTYLANTECTHIAATQDFTHFENLTLPPFPAEAPPGATTGDCTVQIDPAGRLWYSTLVISGNLGQLLAGLQAARSDDGGKSWALNDYFHVAAAPPTDVAVGSDRQWLAFDGNKSVYFAFWNFVQSQAYVARSDDDGSLWGPMIPMPGVIPGPPMVDDKGTLHSPSLTYSAPFQVIDAQSSDGGLQFSQVTVYHAPSGLSWGAYPTITQAQGTLYMAWQDESQRVEVASSTDHGATWSAPIQWNAKGQKLTPGQRADRDGASPAIATDGKRLAVMWYAQDGGIQQAMVATAPVAQAMKGPSFTAAAASYNYTKQTSDFSDFAFLPNGRLAVAFTEPQVGMRLAVEAAAPAPVTP
ncbi:MAG: sialidase family protein [Thermoplasmatota archaeon]